MIVEKGQTKQYLAALEVQRKRRRKDPRIEALWLGYAEVKQRKAGTSK